MVACSWTRTVVNQFDRSLKASPNLLGAAIFEFAKQKRACETCSSHASFYFADVARQIRYLLGKGLECQSREESLCGRVG
jgi:hypothetical protein